MANPVIFFSCHNIDTTQLLSHLQFRYLQITNIQAIGFPKGNSENMHEGIFDVLPVVDLNGVVQRGDDLDFHSRFDVDAVAAFAAFGSYSVKCHCQYSFVIENQELLQWQSAVNLLQLRFGEHLEPVLPVTGLFVIELTAVYN